MSTLPRTASATSLPTFRQSRVNDVASFTLYPIEAIAQAVSGRGRKAQHAWTESTTWKTWARTWPLAQDSASPTALRFGWRSHVAGVRNLTQVEAAERSRLLDVTSYDIKLDLSKAGIAGNQVFRCVTEVNFRCSEPGASTFIEVAAERIHSATLNGAPVDLSGWSAERGL